MNGNHMDDQKDISKIPKITVNSSEEHGVSANGIERPPYDAVEGNEDRGIRRQRSEISLLNGKDHRHYGIRENIDCNGESTGKMKGTFGLSLMKDPVFLYSSPPIFVRALE
ncbi:hypothetical protein PV325_010259 [Microctonus aethiopoides]|nr:hypothetical protein PV325_010259 [Microctonus aethiopoides]